ncbi:MAG: alpha/beta fold hydrolase [Clostridia bacterium]|nr:alpha/beta fold hydrolase [Clostridia bacterium]
MKKFSAILLTAILMFSLATPAFAAVNVNASKSQIPIIRISGDGETLYDDKGNALETGTGVFSALESEDGDNEELYRSIAHVLLPFLIDGLIYDQWDGYYDALYEEISELFGNALLDKNGDPLDNSGLSASRKQQLKNDMNTDKYGSKKYYGVEDYRFYYDWRLDPTAIADDFNDYINAIRIKTGHDKVGIVASCLGTSIVMAYLAEYGSDAVSGIGLDGSVCNGSEILSQTISGKFTVDGDSLTRVLEDSNYLGVFDVDEFLLATVDLLSKSGAIDGITTSVKKTIYDKVVKGVTSALALSTLCTWPGYWSTVSAEDYDDAMLYVFGEKGSAKRVEYAGLIEKIENYNVVRGKTDDLLIAAKAKGVNIGIVSKYGYQIIPICESGSELADELVTVEKSSFGATTSKIYDTLSDIYLAQMTPEKRKYVSPDKQVDASTCLFPDSTWFIKGASHAHWTDEEIQILYDVASANRQLTVEDTEISQFMVYTYEDDTARKMTTENCDTYVWSESSSTKPTNNPIEKLVNFLKSLFKWFKLLFGKIELPTLPKPTLPQTTTAAAQ